MRIVCTGSRSWTNVGQLESILDRYLANNSRLEVAHGNSYGGGADRFVADWCDSHRGVVDEWPFPVNAEIDGRHRGAPLKRNERMITAFNPEIVLAFRAAGKSNGTDYTVHFARRMGIPVEVHNES
jgi:hypothetical protein